MKLLPKHWRLSTEESQGWRCKNWTKCRGTQKCWSVRTARLECPAEGQIWVAPGSQLRVNPIARFGDWMKSQLNVHCWHEHGHVKNASASNSWEWQGFSLVKAQILRNRWLLAKNSACKNYQARLPSLAVWSYSHPDSCPTEIPTLRTEMSESTSSFTPCIINAPSLWAFSPPDSIFI